LNSGLDYTGSLIGLFGIYPCALAATGIALVLLHGSLFAAMKLPEPHSAALGKAARRFWYCSLLCIEGLVTVMALTLPSARHSWLFWCMVCFAALALAWIKVAGMGGNSRSAFYGSSAAIIAVMLMQGAALFPNLIRNSSDPLRSITIFNSSSATMTVSILTAIALPTTIGYLLLNRYLYRVFTGKLKSDPDSFYGNGKEPHDAG